MIKQSQKYGVADFTKTLLLILCTSSIFAMNAIRGASWNNSSFITMPIAFAIASVLLTVIFLSVTKSGKGGLISVYEESMGEAVGKIMSVLLTLVFIGAAVLPLIQFINVMHDLVYNVEITSLAALVVIILAVLCLSGMEGVMGAASVAVYIVLISILFMLVTTSESFDVYRLFPMLGSYGSAVSATFSQSAYLLPAMLTPLIYRKNLQSDTSVRRVYKIALPVAFVFCTAVHLSIDMVYSYNEFEEMKMPMYHLYHINLTQLGEGFTSRIDKLLFFMWLGGTLLTSALYICTASDIFGRLFKKMDVRPVRVVFVIIVLCMCIIDSVSFVRFNELYTVLDWIKKNGGIILLPIVLVPSLIVLIKCRKGAGKGDEA